MRSGKAEDLPLDGGLFDAVVCADCLEHVDDLGSADGWELGGVLKDGGVFLL